MRSVGLPLSARTEAIDMLSKCNENVCISQLMAVEGGDSIDRPIQDYIFLIFFLIQESPTDRLRTRVGGMCLTYNYKSDRQL